MPSETILSNPTLSAIKMCPKIQLFLTVTTPAGFSKKTSNAKCPPAKNPAKLLENGTTCRIWSINLLVSPYVTRDVAFSREIELGNAAITQQKGGPHEYK